MINDVACIFMCFFAMWILFLLKYLFISFAYFVIGLFTFFTVEFWEFAIESTYKFLENTGIFFHSISCLFTFLVVSFEVQKFVILRCLNTLFYAYLISSTITSISPKQQTSTSPKTIALCFLKPQYSTLHSIFHRAKFKIFDQVQFVGSLMDCAFGVMSKSSSLSPRSQRLCLCFPYM